VDFYIIHSCPLGNVADGNLLHLISQEDNDYHEFCSNLGFDCKTQCPAGIEGLFFLLVSFLDSLYLSAAVGLVVDLEVLRGVHREAIFSSAKQAFFFVTVSPDLFL